MEENKNCCDLKEGEKCNNCCMWKCCAWKKCRVMKHLIWIILIIIVFCLGVQLGELKSEARGFHFGCGGRMMDWEYKNVKPFTGEFPVSPTAPNPETKQ